RRVGGGSPFAAEDRRPGRDHHTRIETDREEAFRDTTRMLELKRPELTPDGTLELRNHTVRVTIPPGVTAGQLIRLAGQGEPASGRGSAGDLYLETHIRPHRLFQLDGRDVTLDRKSTRLNSSHGSISYAVFCLKKKNKKA